MQTIWQSNLKTTALQHNDKHNSEPLQEILFTPNWITDFAELWNKPENKLAWQKLAGFGFVRFGLETKEEQIIHSCALVWDSMGKVEVVNDSKETPEAPSFYSQVNVWESVIYKFYTPIHAVMYKKMRYIGVMQFALAFSDQFEYIAAIATAVNLKYLNL